MSRIYLDSCMVIGLIEGDFGQRTVLKQQIPKHTVYASELVRMEARIMPLREGNQAALKRFDAFFDACHAMIALDRAVFERATQLRLHRSIKTPDALHIAAAIEAGCDEFWTADKRLNSFTGSHLRIFDWPELEMRTGYGD